MNYLTLAVNLKNLAISQYTNYNFNSFAKIGDTHIGFNEDGIYELDNAQDDDGTAIDAFAELVRSDWGVSNQKRVRTIYIGYEANGVLQLILSTDEATAETYTLTPTLSANKQGSGELHGRRSQKGRHWDIKIANTLGCDFSLDSIHILPTILNSKPRGS